MSATPAGAYLRATATNSPAELHLDDAARALFARAFRLAVVARFRPECPLPEITLAVARALDRHAAVALPAREAEMLVRDALGEDVPIAGIAPDRVVATHVLLFAAFADELALTEEEFDELITEAEQQITV
jgi:hypothetical protein